MKQLKIYLFALLATCFIGYNAAGQANASLNILTQNTGRVLQGGVEVIQVTVGASIGLGGQPGPIPGNKVRVQISIPIAIAMAAPNIDQTGLPPGWVILSNTGDAITICNGSDIIPVGQQRQIFIKVQGTNVGGPSTITGSLSFGPGTGVCTGPGSLAGDNIADNTSTTSIEVFPPTSCILIVNASAGTIDCNGGSTTLTATSTGAAGAVEYSVNGGAFQSGNTFTVVAGTYTVTARVVANPICTATATSVTISQPTPVLVNATASPIELPGGTTTVTVTASGGTAPYTGTGVFTNVTAGTYTYTVTDSKGCTGSTTLTLNDPIAGNANASLNILTLNAGQVVQGSVVDLQVSVGNTGPSFIGVNKVRAQISIPIAIATALPNAQQTGLPAGWIILSNTGGAITICNGTDQIAANAQRQIYIKIQGTAEGGPSTIAGSLSFGPGTGVCTGPGSLPGDNPGDNTSTSSIQVISQPDNDEAPGSAAPAYTLTVGSGCSGSPYTNTNATQGVGEPFAACQGTAGYKSVWYQFVAPASGNVMITNDYSGGTMGADTRLALFSATNVNDYLTFTNLACDDDNGINVTGRSILYSTGLTAGNTYFIQVDGKDASTAEGTFCLTVDELTSTMLTTSTACAAGKPLTSINDNYSGWLSTTDVNGKLLALIQNPNGGASTSTYTNAININAGPVREDPASFHKYLDRNYTFNNASVTSANVRLFFLNTELTALQAADPGVTLATLQVTRQTGTVCDNDFVAANGTNSSLSALNGTGTGFSWLEVTTPGFSKYYIHTQKAHVPLKTFLQGAYSAGVARHKDVTTVWRNVLQSNALTQPFNAAPFNYSGTENVPASAFTSTTGVNTDVTDWVLVELRSAASPATVIARRAAFIREDGRIVDHLNSSRPISFGSSVNDGNYHIVIRHRNHMAIRTPSTPVSIPKVLTSTMGIPASLHDFSTAQAQAHQNPAITTNPAQRDLTGGVFGMWGGNVNSDGAVRATGLASQNDYLGLISALGNNPAAIISNVYNRADLNLDGTMRATGLSNVNDYLFLVGALDNNPAKIVSQHQ